MSKIAEAQKITREKITTFTVLESNFQAQDAFKRLKKPYMHTGRLIVLLTPHLQV